MTWKQQGDPQSNITFYSDRDVNQPHYPWVEVLTNDMFVQSGQVFHRHVPVFEFRVHRSGVGELGRFTYEPKANPGRRLSPTTVARQVNRWLEAQ